MPDGIARADAIGEDDVTAFWRDGIVCLRGLIDGQTVEALRAEIERELAAPGPLELDLTRGMNGRFFGNTFVCHHRPGFRSFVEDGPGAALAARFLRSTTSTLLFDQLLIKEPGTETPTPWHHDLPYWPVAGDQVCTLWIALDPVTKESGAVEYVKGSHRWGQHYAPIAFVRDGLYRTDLPALPDVAAERDRHDFACYELAPGDATLHHALTIHGAPGNARRDRRRRAYIQRWCGDDMRWAPRPGIQPMLRDPGLVPGDALPCELFPRIWPRRER